MKTKIMKSALWGLAGLACFSLTPALHYLGVNQPEMQTMADAYYEYFLVLGGIGAIVGVMGSFYMSVKAWL